MSYLSISSKTAVCIERAAEINRASQGTFADSEFAGVHLMKPLVVGYCFTLFQAFEAGTDCCRSLSCQILYNKNQFGPSDLRGSSFQLTHVVDVFSSFVSSNLATVDLVKCAVHLGQPEEVGAMRRKQTIVLKD